MKALNAQQMEFARLIAQGSKIAEAYRRAFDCSGKSQAAVTKAAQRLSKNVLVLDYVDTLRQETRREAIIDRVRRMELLSSMAEDCCEVGKVRESIAAIAELNKMDGAYEPQQVQVSGSLGVSAVVAALQAGDAEPFVS